ncbi:MAG TPA: glycosyltransferase family 4 protein [Candidatus Binatia bacterium]|nr:glycosyltransferase family 4 protein [Candidatus Binatia bacterium]
MPQKPLTVAWISDFPVEWLPEIPEPLRSLPRRHPATWQMVLLSEFEKDPDLRVHIILLRQHIARGFSFEQGRTVFHVLKAPPWLRLASLFWLDTALIRGVCKNLKPDLVHAWGMEKGAPMIAHRSGYPYVMTVQGLYGWYKERVPLTGYDRFIERLERLCLRRAPVVTTESSFAVQYLKNRYPKLRVQQAEHAPNRSFFAVRRRPQPSPVHFIYIGTIGFRKGTDLLFKALDELAPTMPFKLTFISSSTPHELQSFQASISPALRERTQFKQSLLPDELARELETPTMLLLPTRADTSPNAVKEAVVAGVPVIASNIGGIPDYVVHGKNGLLFPPGDLQGFIQTLQSACAHPLFSQGQVESQTLAQMREYLSPERMAKNFLQAYELARH